MAELEYVIDNMDAGFSTDAGLGPTGKNGGYWSDLAGLFPREGSLRWAFDGGDAFTTGLTFWGNYAHPTHSNAQRARYAFRRASSSRVWPDVMVTTREIFVADSGGLQHIMSKIKYSTGTAECASTTAVTGDATVDWQTAGIQPGMLIKFSTDANLYTIASIDTEHTLTLVGAGPNTGGKKAYDIYLVFGGNASSTPTQRVSTSKNRIFAQISNGSLYVGGSTVVCGKPGIVKVENVLATDTVSSDCTAKIILAQHSINGTISKTGTIISTLEDIVGMQVLPDGRILIATHELDTKNHIYNRVRCNGISSTDEDEWNDPSKAYFNDLLGPQGESTGVGRIGEAFTVHFSDGIMFGQPTGQQDPPFSWGRTQATRGALCPELLGNYPGGDFFLGPDLRPYTFTGGRETPIGDNTIIKMIQSPGFDGDVYFSESACAYDNITSSFHFFLNKWGTGTATKCGCTHIAIREETNQMFRFEWPSVIGGSNISAVTSDGDSRFYVGRASANQATGARNPSTTSLMLGYFECERWSGNDAAPSHRAVPALTTAPDPPPVDVHAVTNWIDFGQPNRLKTIKRVEFWIRSTSEFDEGDVPDRTENYRVMVECRPMAANPATPFGYGFARPFETTILALPKHKRILGSEGWVPMVVTEFEIARITFDPQTQNLVPPVQSMAGTHFRVGLWPVVAGLNQPAYAPRGLWKMKIVAESGPDPMTVDTEG